MSIDPRVDIGHVHLKVADIDRSLGFYRDRPKEEWPRSPDGEGVAMFNAPLDLQGLITEAG